MNNEGNPTWPSMVPSSGDELASFLDLPDLDIDFSNFDSNAAVGDIVQDDQSTLKSRYSQPALYAGDGGVREEVLQKSASATDMHMLKGRLTGLQVQPGQLPQAEQNAFLGQQQMQFHGQGRIPPTPASLDLRGNQNHFAAMDPQQQQQMYEAQMRNKQQEQMVFTPLGTPAVTPMDSHQYQMPEYAIPGEYFSPLASPALIAQSAAPAERTFYAHHFQAPDHSETTSPVNINFDPSLKRPVTSAPVPKRQKRRSPSGTVKQSTRSVRDSPVMKPQRKKQSGSTVIPPKEVAEVMKSAGRKNTGGDPQQQGDNLGPPTSLQSSESGSISPEPLSDLMPPPKTPKPSSAGRSPHVAPQTELQSASSGQTSASLTPRSLMKIQQPASNGQSQSVSGGDVEMQDISLGEAALDSTPFLPALDTQMTDSQPTPTLAAQKGDLSSSTMSPAPVLPSPAASSAPTPKTLANKTKSDFKAPAKGKKRNSSSVPSPALRPRISPSIKPLLPDSGKMSAETSALLLASKSNYQNLIEGTHLPGVTYPEALSENLTSKRTSHKIAEQGRRNRINTALQEIASLIPHIRESNAGSPPTPQASSKASTVEAAIDYIKSLQAELRATKGKLGDAERKLQEVQGGDLPAKEGANGVS